MRLVRKLGRSCPVSRAGFVALEQWSTCRIACYAAGESLAGRAVAFAEGNALGKGPQILRLGLDDIAWIRRQAAAGNPVFMQLEARASPNLIPCHCARIAQTLLG